MKLNGLGVEYHVYSGANFISVQYVHFYLHLAQSISLADSHPAVGWSSILLNNEVPMFTFREIISTRIVKIIGLRNDVNLFGHYIYIYIYIYIWLRRN